MQRVNVVPARVGGFVRSVRGHVEVRRETLAARHHRVGVTGLDGLGGEHDGLEAGPADLVDRERRHLGRQPRVDGGLAGRGLADLVPGRSAVVPDSVGFLPLVRRVMTRDARRSQLHSPESMLS